MKNITKLLAIIVFIVLLIGLYFYFQKEDSLDNQLNNELEAEDIDYDEYIEQKNQPLDTRLTHDKDIMFIYVAEMNNGALNQLPLGSLVDDEVSFNEDTKSIYFYNEQLAPHQNTDMLILSEVYNYDILLSQNVDNKYEDNANLTFRNIHFNEIDEELQPVNNDNRLFLSESVRINRIDNTDSIEVAFMDEEFILEVDEYKDFILEDGELKSRILIRNFGAWDSINMKYQIKE